MVKGAVFRQGRQLLFVALTVALGISLATAMLNVMFDVGDKVNQELKAFGANITVTSKNSSILNHHALRHHCERKRISAIIRVETTT